MNSAGRQYISTSLVSFEGGFHISILFLLLDWNSLIKGMKVLGLDLGTASIGWALIDVPENMISETELDSVIAKVDALKQKWREETRQTQGSVEENDSDSEEKRWNQYVSENNIEIPAYDLQAELIDFGVRIFPEGNQGGDDSPSKERGNARRTRRRLTRRARRIKRVLSWFQRLQLISRNDIPAIRQNEQDGNEEIHFETKGSIPFQVYQLRKEALERELHPVELLQICMLFAKRRGYQPVKGSSSSVNEETGESETSTIFGNKDPEKPVGIDVSEQLWNEKKLSGECPTWGSFLATLNPHEQRLRFRYFLRHWILDEFDAIIQFQKQFPRYVALFTRENLKQLRDEIIFFQRPLKSQEDKIAKCTFEPTEKRCPISHPLYQEFRIWQDLNHLKFYYHPEMAKNPESDIRPDNLEVKKWNDCPHKPSIVRELLIHQKEISVKAIAKDFLQLKSTQIKQPDNLPEKIKGTYLMRVIQGMYDKERIPVSWMEFLTKLNDGIVPDTERVRVLSIQFWEILKHANDEKEIKDWLKQYFPKWEPSKLNHIARIELPAKYASLSLKAIQNILPFMQEPRLFLNKKTGKEEFRYPVFSEACELAGYKHSESKQQEIKTELPDHGTLRNPVVDKTLRQLRLVVNSILHHYGKPDKIRIELGRDLKQSEKERIKTSKKQKENQKISDNYKEQLKTNFPTLFPESENIKPKDLLRFRLFMEQKEQCLYTGESISMKDLFDNAKYDIDHIVPRSRINLDENSNKALVKRSVNQQKGDKLPTEFFSEEQMKNILQRANDWNLSKKKIKYLAAKDLKEFEGFVNQQLNDTRYAAREARTYLSNLILLEDIECLKGGMTAHFRGRWGLSSDLEEAENQTQKASAAVKLKKPFLQNDFIDVNELHPDELKKSSKLRLDHRHHAIDALVLSLMDRSVVQRFYMNQKGMQAVQRMMPAKFKKQVHQHAKNIIVSHQVDKKPSGKLHKATYYGLLYDKTGNPLQHLFNEKMESVHYNKEGKEVELPKSDGYIYAERKGIVNFTTMDMATSVIDPILRKMMIEFINQSIAEKWKDAELKSRLQNLHHPLTNHRIKSLRKEIRSETIFPIYEFDIHTRTGVNRFVMNESIHRTAVYKSNKTLKFKIHSLLHAYRQKAKHKNLNKFDQQQAGNDTYLYTLHQNEMVLVPQNNQKENPNWKHYTDILKHQKNGKKSKERYHELSPFLFCVKSQNSKNHQLTMYNHLIAKMEILVKDKGNPAKSAKEYPSRIIWSQGTKHFVQNPPVKLLVDPAGFLKVAEF